MLTLTILIWLHRNLGHRLHTCTYIVHNSPLIDLEFYDIMMIADFVTALCRVNTFQQF